MVFSCTIVDSDIYHRVGDFLEQRFQEGEGEYVFGDYIRGPDNRLYGYRYHCMGTDTTVALIPVYREFGSVVIIRGYVEEDILNQLDKLEIPDCVRKINKSS